MKTFAKTLATLVLGMALGSATLAAAAPSTLKAVIADFKIIVNGESKTLTKSPIVVDGTTYLPVREVAGLVGADLKYDGANKKIELTTSLAEEGNQVSKTSLRGEKIVDLLSKKYPEMKTNSGEKLSLTMDGTLTLGDKTIKLTHDSEYNYDVTPLIEQGILVASDIQ
ncbi:hypothetical protein D3C74_137520 [compost metagenome]